MKILSNEKGFTLIELVLIIVILGVLGAVATVQFGNIIKDANNAALDGGPGSYSTQIALTINSLRRLPTSAEFDTFIFPQATPSGGSVVHTIASSVVTMTINGDTDCQDKWTYSGTTGAFTRTYNSRSAC
jgi:prepilin-type N-terminal cleavage/methylation domain-containing protein